MVEFKSERDSLSVNDYNTVLAYALLYSSFERVPTSDITVTFSITVHPRELRKHLRNKRGLDLLSVGDGVTYIKGDILPVQILESKELPEDENLFIKGLRRGNEAGRMSKILKKYDRLLGLDTRNVYIDRLIQANKEAYKEAIGMSEELKKIWGEIADETGWLAEREQAAVAVAARGAARENAKETAKRLLELGVPMDKISIATKLSVEELMELASTSVGAV